MNNRFVVISRHPLMLGNDRTCVYEIVDMESGVVYTQIKISHQEQRFVGDLSPLMNKNGKIVVMGEKCIEALRKAVGALGSRANGGAATDTHIAWSLFDDIEKCCSKNEQAVLKDWQANKMA